MEEIQEIIKNFIYRKQQMKHEITEIEGQRTQLANERNEIKSNIDKKNAYIGEIEADVNELGKTITELGNQSQCLQYKLDKEFLNVKNEVNMGIDNLISESIREIRKIEDVKEETEEKIVGYENRNSKYEVQKQEFFSRFGRMPELSESAQKENQLQEQEYNTAKAEILEMDSKIANLQEEISELVSTKREFKNGNWISITEKDIQQEEMTQNIVEEVIEEVEEKCSIEEKINTLVDNILEEQEETIVLPFVDAVDIDEEQSQIENIIAELKKVEIDCQQPVLEEVKIEDIKPEEIYIEDIKPEEIQMEDIKPEEITIENIDKIETEEISIEALEPLEEINIEEFQPIQEIEIGEIGDIEPIINTDIEEVKNIEETNTENIAQEEIETEISNISEIEVDEAEKEIIVPEEKVVEEPKEKKQIFNGKVTLLNIIAKFEDNELVYKAELSNGKSIKIYPVKENSENILLKDKENKEEIKEILINYAISEYKSLDRKVIKKIDPIVCELLAEFAKEYDYDVQNLIYNYAMSFSNSEEVEADLAQITYNFAFIEETKLSKKEKEILLKVCKNAKKNDRIEVIGSNTGFKKIKYIFKRIFSLNNANALPEGKY